MIFAFAIPNEFSTAVIGAIFGGFVVYLTQKLTERRERRNRRDELRLELYLEVVDLVLDNQLALAARGAEGAIPPVELQTKRLRISHRLKLLGSADVQAAYDAYRHLVFQETAHPIENRPQNPNDVDGARDKLIDLMAKDVQQT